MSTKKKIIISIISVLTALVITATLCLVFAWSGILNKGLDDENTEYRILQLSDIHLRNDNRDNRAKETITMMVNATRPDKIVITGDISSNYINEPDFRHAFDLIDSFGIDWTMTFGNHDTEGLATKARVIEMMHEYSNCSFPKVNNLTESGDFEAVTKYSAGVEFGVAARPEIVAQKINEQDSRGNYYEYVTDKNGKKIMSLFYMDSNMYASHNGINGYANFREEQIDWYSKSIDAITADNNGKILPSLAFFHIPMQEFETAYNEGEILGGLKWEDVYSPVVDDQMFETMVSKNSTKACFVGHDHMNSYVAEYQNIKLAYAYTCDHTLYLAPQLGGRVINIKSDSSFTMQAIYRFRGIGEIIMEKPIR